jgi:hypothetical protein
VQESQTPKLRLNCSLAGVLCRLRNTVLRREVFADVGPDFAARIGPWERFTMVTIDARHCALMTGDGHFVTAVNGGGWGGSDASNRFPIHTNAATTGAAETFTIVAQ